MNPDPLTELRGSVEEINTTVAALIAPCFAAPPAARAVVLVESSEGFRIAAFNVDTDEVHLLLMDAMLAFAAKTGIQVTHNAPSTVQ